MSVNSIKKIAIVGIDGSGKSTIVRELLSQYPAKQDAVMALACPQYHDKPNIPLSDLSKAMDVFSKTADTLGSFELKAAALFLQMTLYGPIEQFLLEQYQPKLLISERHPIIDALAYSPFYTFMINQRPSPEAFEKPLAEAINQVYDHAYADILQWQTLQNKRLQQTTSIWELPFFLKALVEKAPEIVFKELSQQFRSSLPDTVLLLDPGIDEAIKRIHERSSDQEEKELHESGESLKYLSQSYSETLRNLQKIAPSMQIATINTGNGKSIENTIAQVREYMN